MAWVPLSYILLTLVKRIIVFPAIPMVKLHFFKYTLISAVCQVVGV